MQVQIILSCQKSKFKQCSPVSNREAFRLFSEQIKSLSLITVYVNKVSPYSNSNYLSSTV